jgi:hypothetical protein
MLTGKRITIVTGDPTREEYVAISRAVREIQKRENPEKKYRTSWARLKIANSLPRKWGNTPS